MCSLLLYIIIHVFEPTLKVNHYCYTISLYGLLESFVGLCVLLHTFVCVCVLVDSVCSLWKTLKTTTVLIMMAYCDFPIVLWLLLFTACCRNALNQIWGEASRAGRGKIDIFWDRTDPSQKSRRNEACYRWDSSWKGECNGRRVCFAIVLSVIGCFQYIVFTATGETGC